MARSGSGTRTRLPGSHARAPAGRRLSQNGAPEPCAAVTEEAGQPSSRGREPRCVTERAQARLHRHDRRHPGDRHELHPHRRPCLPLRPALLRAGRPGRVGRVAVLPPLRRPVGIRPAARRRRRALAGAAGRQIDSGRPPPRYAGRTLALETSFRTADGELVLTDALGLAPENDGHRIGVDVPHVLVRRLACTSGEIDVLVDYRPRPEYGLIVPLLSHPDGGVAARGGADWLVLTLPGEVALQDGRATARLRLRAGDVVHLALQRSTLGDAVPAHVWSQDELAELLDRTLRS